MIRILYRFVDVPTDPPLHQSVPCVVDDAKAGWIFHDVNDTFMVNMPTTQKLIWALGCIAVEHKLT
jgi:hypothetical protein